MQANCDTIAKIRSSVRVVDFYAQEKQYYRRKYFGLGKMSYY